MQFEHIELRAAGVQHIVAQSYPLLTVAALLRPVFARVIHEHLAHRPRRHREELLVVCLHANGQVAALHLDECLVYQGGRLQRVVAALAAELPLRKLAQLVVDNPEQFSNRPVIVDGLVALAIGGLVEWQK